MMNDSCWEVQVSTPYIVWCIFPSPDVKWVICALESTRERTRRWLGCAMSRTFARDTICLVFVAEIDWRRNGRERLFVQRAARASERPVLPPSVQAKEKIDDQSSTGHRSMAGGEMK